MTASAFVRTSVALLFCMAAAVWNSAHAQNYDGAGLLRFGVIGQVSSHSFDVQLPYEAQGSLSAASFAGGASFGYDYMVHPGWIVGIETDVVADGWQENRGLREYSIDYLATVRARLGAYVRPDLLLYATGGLSLLGVSFKGVFDEETQSRFVDSQTLPGWNVGVGAEFDWLGMSFFGEYLYGNYGSFSFNERIGTSLVVRNDVDVDQHLFRFGVKFITGHDYRESYYTGCCGAY